MPLNIYFLMIAKRLKINSQVPIKFVTVTKIHYESGEFGMYVS